MGAMTRTDSCGYMQYICVCECVYVRCAHRTSFDDFHDSISMLRTRSTLIHWTCLPFHSFITIPALFMDMIKLAGNISAHRNMSRLSNWPMRPEHENGDKTRTCLNMRVCLIKGIGRLSSIAGRTVPDNRLTATDSFVWSRRKWPNNMVCHDCAQLMNGHIQM